jgi:hypothetical protein
MQTESGFRGRLPAQANGAHICDSIVRRTMHVGRTSGFLGHMHQKSSRRYTGKQEHVLWQCLTVTSMGALPLEKSQEKDSRQLEQYRLL